jgi:hypothetical protein
MNKYVLIWSLMVIVQAGVIAGMMASDRIGFGWFMYLWTSITIAAAYISWTDE